MDKVQKNLSDIERKVTKTNKIVSKGDKMSLGDAIKLGRKSNSIVSTIKKGIKEYDGTTPTDEESQKIMEQIRTIVKLTEIQLNLLVENKATFEKLHVAGLVKKNMAKIEDVSIELSKVMISKAPAHMMDEANDLEKHRAAAFKKTTGAFANSAGGEDQADGEDDSD